MDNVKGLEQLAALRFGEIIKRLEAYKTIDELLPLSDDALKAWEEVSALALDISTRALAVNNQCVELAERFKAELAEYKDIPAAEV